MSRYLRWLLPGLGLKRWLALSVLGVFLMGLGVSLAVRSQLYARVELWLLMHISYTSKFFSFAPWLFAAAFVVIGILMAIAGGVRLVRAVLETLLPPMERMADAYYQRRYLVRGPRLVAVGGGTGIPALLRGMKEYSSNLTAVITVADDGGSSGRLRSQFGILPPGDIRNCLVALADTEPLMERLFQYRFQQGEGLEGHPFGNLFILAMSETTGNFYDAIQAASQVLAVRGRVMPSTLDHVVLKAQLANGEVLVGESVIGDSPSPIRRVYLDRPVESGEIEPNSEIQPLNDALRAIEEAEVIVLGPGSLYTSIIPNLLVPGVADAIRRSHAMKVYVCNIMTQPGETDSYSVSQHVKALIDHAGYGIIDTVIVNNAPVSEAILRRYMEQNARPVKVDVKETERLGVEVLLGDVLDTRRELVRHHSDKVARLICELFLVRRGHRERNPLDVFVLRQRLTQRIWGEKS